MAVFFFEPGRLPCLPGLAEATPTTFFPFWGNYTLLDFQLANFQAGERFDCFFLLSPDQKPLQLRLSSRMGKKRARVIILEEGIDSFLEVIQSLDVSRVIFLSLSFAALFNPASFPGPGAGEAAGIFKVAIDSCPLDMYCGTKESMLRAFKAGLNQYLEKMGLEEFLFTRLLPTCFEQVIERPGKVFFHNNVGELYRNNLWLIKNQLSREHGAVSRAAAPGPDPGKGAYIAPTGIAVNALLSPGVEVFGKVENSILFPDVIVGENARICDSVVMSGNRIGENCRIKDTILFPYFDESQNKDYNISNNVVIGGQNSSARNSSFPDQINAGLCVLGMNISLPAGFIIESGAFLPDGTQEKELGGVEMIKKGTSFKRMPPAGRGVHKDFVR